MLAVRGLLTEVEEAERDVAHMRIQCASFGGCSLGSGYVVEGSIARRKIEVTDCGRSSGAIAPL